MKVRILLFLVGLLTGLGATPSLASIRAVIDKSEQRMYVYLDGNLHYTWLASTGKKSTYTPTGTFHPYKRLKHHISSTYGKPMAWAVYYKGTRAIHGTDGLDDALLGSPASMGCTHITNDQAKIFYGLVEKYGNAGVTIVIQE